MKNPSGVNVDAECQTTDGVFLSGEEYDKLLKQASLCLDFKNNLNYIRSLLQNLEKPEMNPDGFQKLCRDCGAENMYFCIYDAICTEQVSDECKCLVITICKQSFGENVFTRCLTLETCTFGPRNIHC